MDTGADPELENGGSRHFKGPLIKTSLGIYICVLGI